MGEEGPHEAAVLRLDCSKIYALLGWEPRWHAERAVAETVAWTKAWLRGEDMDDFTKRQIEGYV